MYTILTILIIGGLLIAGIKACINIYNSIVALHQNVDKAFSNIDIILKQRADEIPDLVKVVKANTDYESETLEKLITLRTAYLNATTDDEKIAIQNDLQKGISQIIAVAESYPELKANNAFLQLQSRISEMEDKIADRREFYNECVNLYNIGIKTFPNVIFANIFSYQTKQLLSIPKEETKYEGINI